MFWFTCHAVGDDPIVSGVLIWIQGEWCIMSDKMLQEVMTSPGCIEFHSVDVPVPAEGQVLVRIHQIGVCGSDIHVYHGKHPFTKYPVTQGHEVSAEVISLGNPFQGKETVCDADGNPITVGEKVTIEPQVYCGKCYPCTHGKYNLCEQLKVMGFQTTGTASEYFAVDGSKITRLPDNLSYTEGAMIEPLAVTVHAAKRFADMKGAKVAILGAGPIGILLAQSVKAFGASEVMITDVSDYRLGLAKSICADYAVNTSKEEFSKALINCFGQDKAEVIYDCAGNDITMDQAIQNARKGSLIVLVAVFAKRANVDLAVLNDHELTLDTTMMYRHEDYVDAIRLVSEGKIRLKPLENRHFPFKNYLDAYRYIDDNRETTMKVLIDVTE